MIEKNLINEALSLCPPFESYFNDMVQVPILEPTIVVMNESYVPSAESKQKIITFRKNYKTGSWEFDSKNFD